LIMESGISQSARQAGASTLASVAACPHARARRHRDACAPAPPQWGDVTPLRRLLSLTTRPGWHARGRQRSCCHIHHRSHFGSRYTLSCRSSAGLFADWCCPHARTRHTGREHVLLTLLARYAAVPLSRTGLDLGACRPEAHVVSRLLAPVGVA